MQRQARRGGWLTCPLQRPKTDFGLEDLLGSQSNAAMNHFMGDGMSGSFNAARPSRGNTVKSEHSCGVGVALLRVLTRSCSQAPSPSLCRSLLWAARAPCKCRTLCAVRRVEASMAQRYRRAEASFFFVF